MALRLALDANAYTDFCRGESRAVDAVQRAGEVVLPAVALGELRAGFRCGKRSEQNEAVLDEFVRHHRVSVPAVDEATTRVYADLYAVLRAAGTPVPTNDLWIAATVVQHDLILLTRDRHFELIPRVPRL